MTESAPTIPKMTPEDAIPKPHSRFFHPDMSWVDVLLGIFLQFYLRLRSLPPLPPSTTRETMEVLEGIRCRIRKSASMGTKRVLQELSRLRKAAVIECHLNIPRKVNILNEWGILQKDDKILEENVKLPDNDTIRVLVRLSSSLLPEKEYHDCPISEETGCKQMVSLDLTMIPDEVPIMIWFHGGGYVVGGIEDSQFEIDLIALTKARQELLQKETETPSSQTVELVTLTVDYSLAPDYPFPAATIDALSVVEYASQACPSRKFHIAGCSAGGHLALSTGFEAYRKYPGRISSISSFAPMISPSADTISYYLNGSAANVAPVDWLRWSWQALLGMQPDDPSSNTDEGRTLDEICTRGSNQKAWEQCKWKKNDNTRRLVDLLFNPPLDLDSKGAPEFIISTNKADALHYEGVGMVRTLQERNATVTHLDIRGEHFVGGISDSTKEKERLETWARAVWRA